MTDATRNANVVLTAQVSPYAQSMQTATQQTNSLAQAVDNLVGKLDGITKRAGKKLQLFGGGDLLGLGAMTIQAAQFEKQMDTLRARTVITGQSFSQLEKGVKGLTQSFPVATSQAIALYNEISKLGVTSPQDISKISKAMVQMSAAVGENVDGLAQSMTQLSRQMATSYSNIDKFSNSLLVVSVNSGVSASGVLQFSQAIAPMARAAGIGEAQLLGISAAFSKAGADGYTAANAFQQIMQQIVQDSANGSPDLAKFSNLIGVTTDQLKKMDKAQALSQIFDAINKAGPNAINILDQMGLDGVRTAKAIQAVAQQSGGMAQAINQAVQAYGGTDLAKASKTAFSGLSDQLTQMKNQWGDIGRTIGANFLSPLQFALKPLQIMVSLLDKLSQTNFGKIGAWLAAFGGIATFGAGTALRTLGLAGKVGTAAWLANSGPVGGLIGGVMAGLGRGGRWQTKAEEGFPETLAGRVQGGAYRFGLGATSLIRGRGPGGEALPEGLRRFNAMDVLTAPIRSFRWMMDQQSAQMAEANTPGFDRASLTGEPNPASWGRRVLATATHIPSAVMGARAAGGAEGTLNPSTLESSGRAVVASMVNLGRAAMTTTGEQKALASETGALVRAFGRLTIETQKAALGALAPVGSKVAGGIKSGLGSLMGFLGGPWGLGLMGVTAGMTGWNMYQNAKTKSQDFSSTDINPIQKYNDVLGIATTSLNSFTQAVNSATNALPNPSSMQEAQNISPSVADLAKKPGRSLVDSTFAGLKSNAQRSAYLSTLNVTDPRQLQLIEADLLQSNGGNLPAAQQLIDQMMGRAPGGPSSVYRAMDSLQFQRTGWGLPLTGDTTAKAIAGSAIGQISNRYNADELAYNSQYASYNQVRGLGALLGAGLPGAFGGQRDASFTQILNALKKQTGSTFGLKRSELIGAAGGTTAVSGMSQDQLTTLVLKQIWANKEGRTFLQSQGIKSEADLSNLSALTQGVAQPYSNPTVARYRQSMLGAQIFNPSAPTSFGFAVQQGVAQQGNPNAQITAINSLQSNAVSLSGSFAGADKALQDFKAAVNDPTDPLYKLADAAQSLNETLRQQSMVGMSRTQVLTSNAATATSLMHSTGPDAQARQQQGLQMAFGSINDARNYVADLVQVNKDYQVQMGQLNRDYNQQVANSTHQFHVSQVRAQQDYNKQLVRMAEDAANQMISPYQRMQNVYTASADTIVQNLKDQAMHMKDQLAQVAKLKKEGLSQTSIDQLDLTNFAQNVQVERLSTMSSSQIQQVNAAAASRMKAGGSLAETPLNKQFARTQQDWKLQMQRSAQDFSTQMGIMAQMHQNQLADSAAALKRYGQQVIGGFDSVMGQAIDLLKKNLGTGADAVIAQIQAMAGPVHDLMALVGQTQTAATALKNAPHAAVAAMAAQDARDAASSTLANAPQLTVPGMNKPLPITKGSDLKFAFGGIATKMLVGETGYAEGIIPLNTQGAMFMAETMAIALKRLNTHAAMPVSRGSSGGSVTLDQSVKVMGPVTVQAANLKDFQAQVTQRARLNKLKNPAATSTT